MYALSKVLPTGLTLVSWTCRVASPPQVVKSHTAATKLEISLAAGRSKSIHSCIGKAVQKTENGLSFTYWKIECQMCCDAMRWDLDFDFIWISGLMPRILQGGVVSYHRGVVFSGKLYRDSGLSPVSVFTSHGARSRGGSMETTITWSMLVPW